MNAAYGMYKGGVENDDILGRNVDETTGYVVTLMTCPPEAVDGNGPNFERLNAETMYVIISEQYVEDVMSGKDSSKEAFISYGMMVGDLLRQGHIELERANAQTKNRTKWFRRNKEETA